MNANLEILGPLLEERSDFDQQILKYPWVGLVNMNDFLYYVLTSVNTNVTLSVLMASWQVQREKFMKKELQRFSTLSS